MEIQAIGAIIGIIIFIALFIIILIATSYTSQPQTVSSTVVIDNNTDMESEILKLVNDVRSNGATCGDIYKPPLQSNKQLTDAAQGHGR